MKFSKLVEHVSKKPIPPHAKHLLAEVMVSDAEGEDVDVSLVCKRELRTLTVVLGAICCYPDIVTELLLR